MSIPENNIDFNTIDRFLELLTGAPNPSVNWRFLPDSEQAKANDNEYTRKNFTGRAAEVRGELLDYQEHEYGIFVVVNAGGHSKLTATTDRSPKRGTRLPTSLRYAVRHDGTLIGVWTIARLISLRLRRSVLSHTTLPTRVCMIFPESCASPGPSITKPTLHWSRWK